MISPQLMSIQDTNFQTYEHPRKIQTFKHMIRSEDFKCGRARQQTFPPLHNVSGATFAVSAASLEHPSPCIDLPLCLQPLLQHERPPSTVPAPLLQVYCHPLCLPSQKLLLTAHFLAQDPSVEIYRNVGVALLCARIIPKSGSSADSAGHPFPESVSHCTSHCTWSLCCQC